MKAPLLLLGNISVTYVVSVVVERDLREKRAGSTYTVYYTVHIRAGELAKKFLRWSKHERMSP